MAEKDTDEALKPPDWFIKICKRLYGKRSFIWSMLVLGIALNVFATLLFTSWPWTTTLKPTSTPIAWAFQNPWVIFIIGFFLVLLWIIIFLGSRLSTEPSTKVLSRYYLKNVILETELLTLRGIPAGLIFESVRLDEVFIPLQLRPNRPRADYPLTDKELESYRQLMRSGTSSREMDRIVLDAERNWQHLLKDSDRISIADLWQLLTFDHPTAVIQGYPGMGKSTLMERLTLHMARRMLHQPDPEMLEAGSFNSGLVPLLVRLGKYAGELEKTPYLSLAEYLTILLGEVQLSNCAAFIEQSLQSGSCLVIFDGLDEVSDPQRRESVQEAIRVFIKKYRATTGKTYNRFLITSRVAGYDQAAFPDYRHFTIAELTSEQIDYFIPRWCRTNVLRARGLSTSSYSDRDAALAREIEHRKKELEAAVNGNQSVRELAMNPLLLTLLAVMQQNSIELPRRRVELYDTVTRTLLENRNIAKKLDTIPEVQAIKYLGPLAFQMQDAGNSFARHSDVIDALVQAISAPGNATSEEEAEKFLARVRARGGLFVQRTGDYFGFMHRTFQEYFAARYVLNQIKLKQEEWIALLVERARRKDALWREPFLLAVAYQSGENEQIADEIIRVLLNVSQRATAEERLNDVLLATECLIGAKPLTIDPALEEQIAERLLQMYETAQKERAFDTCQRIENVVQRRLLILHKEDSRPLFLTALSRWIGDTGQSAHQKAALTLLTLIAQGLQSGPSIVFDTLVPFLLALSRLDAVGKFQPTSSISLSSDLTVADLSLAALSFMGEPGPAGQLLLFVRQHFKDHPERVRLLARYSLECEILITPTVVPLAQESYKEYETAIELWIALRDQYQVKRITERDVDTCLAIHTALLSCAQEASYPTAMYLLQMLQATVDHPDRPWKVTWQDYLRNQLSSERYIHYREVAILWTMLFADKQELKALTELILQHYNSNKASLQRNAQRLIASLSEELRDLRDLNELNDLRDLNESRYLNRLRDLRYLKYLNQLRGLRLLRELMLLSKLMELVDLSQLSHLIELRQMRYLREFLLTGEVMQQVLKRIPSADSILYGDLLKILLGHVLQVQETDEMSTIIEGEVQQIVDVVKNTIASRNVDEEVLGSALDIIRYLPAHSAPEVNIILQLAESMADIHVQGACANALRYARPKTPDAWAALESGKQSSIQILWGAVEEALKRK